MINRLFQVVTVLFLTAVVSQAQITNVTDDQSAPIPGAGHDYIKMLSETVNPANGSVSIRIAVPTPKSRGLSVPFLFAYDSNGVHIPTGFAGSGYWTKGKLFLYSGGWLYSLPELSFQAGTFLEGSRNCPYYTAFVFSDPLGGRHAFPIYALSGASPCTNYLSPGNGDDQYRATFDGTANPPQAVRVASADGTVYHFPFGSPNGALPDYIEDRNGNRSYISGTGSVTDTAGRAEIVSSGFGATG